MTSALNAVSEQEIVSLKPYARAARSAMESPSLLPSALLLAASPRTNRRFSSFVSIFSETELIRSSLPAAAGR